MTLFLGGGGDVDVSVLMDRAFFKFLSAKDKILYISAAWDDGGYTHCFEWFSALADKYVNMPKENIVMLSEETEIPDLAEFKAVYIGGGNTYKLLDYVCRTGLKDKLIAYLNGGGLVFGGSAGAIIFGATIETVPEEKENYPDNQAVAYLPKYALRCHYEENLEPLYKELSGLITFPIITLPEDSGLIVDNDRITVVGRAIIFHNGNKVQNRSL